MNINFRFSFLFLVFISSSSLGQLDPYPTKVYIPATPVEEFSLPQESNVELSVYNSLGELVSTLINEIKESGIHSIKFSADHLPSGLYIAS